MLRDNLAGLIQPMVARAGADPLAGHHQAGQTGGCSRSTEVAIVALKRSWRKVFRWKTEPTGRKSKMARFGSDHCDSGLSCGWYRMCEFRKF